MTLLLNCHELAKAYGSRELFKGISLGVFRGDKIGLIGPNGAGKSSLLKILAGIDLPDSGTVSFRKSLRLGYVPQTTEYPAIPIDEVILQAYSQDAPLPIHEQQLQVRILLSKLGFKDLSQLANTLSGGWKKRLDLATQLINSPDVLFLDEPTNHLDLDGIVWLEKFLHQEQIAFIVTSHDRYFLQNVVTRVMELNSVYPEGLFTSEGDYLTFLEKKDEFLAQQKQFERGLASKVREEVHWLRQSPKARTTKAQARIQGAGRLIQELSDIRGRNRQKTAKIDFEATDRQTRKLLATKNLSKSLGNRLLFSGVDLTLVPGMRLGIVGTNGSGKTTLLRLLAGELEPDKGTIKYADDLQIVYFDQHRQLLNPDDTLRRALSPNSDNVIYRGQSIHVNSWAKRFLFSPERLDLPIRQLSGGERARIGIARLMLKPADILLLDEPTNDLDIATLETLEESLSEFPGAIVLITHDRALLDGLTNCVIGLGATSTPPQLADYLQWEEYIDQHQASTSPQNPSSANAKKIPEAKLLPTPQKISYKEKKELDEMEQNILSVEKEIAQLEKNLHDHTANNKMTELQEVCQKLDQAHQKLERLFQRWQDLEKRNSESRIQNSE